MDVTVLKLVHAVDSLGLVVLMKGLGDSGLSHVEASALTLDSNLGGQPIPAGIGLAPVTCGAVSIAGSHLRLRNLRAINWGCQAPHECFVLGLSGTQADGGVNNVIEDCIVEKMSENNTHESTLISSVGGNGDTANGRACIVRNNYTNSEYSNGFLPGPVRVTSIARVNSTTALLTTDGPHWHLKSKNLVVRGALVSGSLNNAYNGVFAINEIVSATQLKYLLHADPGTDADANTGTIGHGISSEQIAIGDVGNYQQTDEFVTITTKRPHNRTPGQAVVILGINGPGTPPTMPFNKDKLTTYHRIVSVDYNPAFSGDQFHPNRFTIRLPENAPLWSQLSFSSAFIGVSTHGPAAGGGTGCVTEGNRVYDAHIACYTDTGSTRDLVVRNNYWSNVDWGFYHNMGGAGLVRLGAASSFGTAISAASLTRDPNDDTLAVFETSTPHGFADRDIVLVSGASIAGYNGVFQIRVNPGESTIFRYFMAAAQSEDPSGGQAAKQVASCIANAGTLATFTVPTGEPHGLLPGYAVDVQRVFVAGLPDPQDNPFNGTFTVKSILSLTSFEYQLPSSPSGIALGTPQFRHRWQTRRLAIERNRIELRSVDPNSLSSPVGVSLADYKAGEVPTPQNEAQPAYIFPQALIRENTMGYVNNGSDTRVPPNTAGLFVTRGDGVILESNLMDVKSGPQKQLAQWASRDVKYFNNRDSAGNLLRGYNWNTGTLKSKLEEAVEAALLLSF